MTRVFYVPEEDNPGRHGEVVRQDTEARLRQRGVEFLAVLGTPLHRDGQIKTGSVLDAHGASVWTLAQAAELVRLMAAGEVGGSDAILMDDMLNLGYSALPFVLEQTPKARRPLVCVRCLAGSTDPDDFTFHWRRWMRHFENVVDETVDGFLVACTELATHMRSGMLDKAPIYVTGLPFDMHRVRATVPGANPLAQRPRRVTYASRLDSEKQPHLALDVWERGRFRERNAELAIASGFAELKSSDPSVIERVKRMEAEGLLSTRVGLSRQEYYALLADSRVLLITGRQDWISNVAMEASALGTPVLAPAFRSFPETLNNDPRHLFVPWSVGDAVEKLHALVDAQHVENVGYVACTQHASLDRTIDVLLGKGDRWLYRGPRREPA